MLTQQDSKSKKICTSPSLSCRACIYEDNNGVCKCNNDSEIKPIVIMMDKPAITKKKRNAKKIKT